MKNVKMVPAICTQCGGKIEVDNSKDAAICPYCGTAFVVEKAIKGNSCIVKSTKFNPKRKEFFLRLNNGEDFILLIKELTMKTIKEKVKIKFVSLLKGLKQVLNK